MMFVGVGYCLAIFLCHDDKKIVVTGCLCCDICAYVKYVQVKNTLLCVCFITCISSLSVCYCAVIILLLLSITCLFVLS